ACPAGAGGAVRATGGRGERRPGGARHRAGWDRPPAVTTRSRPPAPRLAGGVSCGDRRPARSAARLPLLLCLASAEPTADDLAPRAAGVALVEVVGVTEKDARPATARSATR